MCDMNQILFNGGDYNLVVYISDNMITPGTYVNAEFNKPDYYKMSQLDKLADLVNSVINTAVSTDSIKLVSNNGINLTQPNVTNVTVTPPKNTKINTFSKIIDEVSPTPYVNLKMGSSPGLNSITIPFTVGDNGLININVTGTSSNQIIISTYDDVINYFSPGNGKVFITGYTNSKFSLIDKYFTKNNVGITKGVSIESNVKPVNLPTIQNFNVFLTPNAGSFTANIQKIEPTVTPVKVSQPAQPTYNIQNNIKLIGTNTNNKPTVIPTNYNNISNIRTKISLLIPGLNFYTMILSEDPISGLSEYVFYINTENPIKYVDIGNGYSIFTYLRTEDTETPTTNMILYDSYVEEPKILSEVFIDRGVNTAFENIKKLKNIKSLDELTKSGLGFYKINTKGYNF